MNVCVCVCVTHVHAHARTCFASPASPTVIVHPAEVKSTPPRLTDLLLLVMPLIAVVWNVSGVGPLLMLLNLWMPMLSDRSTRVEAAGAAAPLASACSSARTSTLTGTDMLKVYAPAFSLSS